MSENHGKQPEFFFDNEPEQWPRPTVSGQELRDKFAVPANVQIFQKVPGHTDREILPGTVVDLSPKGPERFFTQAVGSGAGLQRGLATLLLEDDYSKLKEQGVTWEEDGGSRFLVLKDRPLAKGLYTQQKADVLVQIPANYNQDGIDMLWLAPRLDRADGKEIAAQMPYGSPNNVTYAGLEFCRWSRHWTEPAVGWKPGADNIETILRRVTWALEHPGANP